MPFMHNKLITQIEHSQGLDTDSCDVLCISQADEVQSTITSALRS